MKGTKLRPKQYVATIKKELLLFCTLPSSFKSVYLYLEKGGKKEDIKKTCVRVDFRWNKKKFSKLIQELVAQIIYYIQVIADPAKLLQSCMTLCDPIDGSPPGSPVPGILQARTLEWGAISFSSA